MKMKSLLLVLFFHSTLLFGTVEKSILPLMDNPFTPELSKKLNQSQREEIETLCPVASNKVRVMSFNMLFNLPFAEEKLAQENKWKNRKTRVIEYLLFASPDIIGSQELQKSQLTDLMEEIGNEYSYYGVGMRDGKTKGDIPAIFYRKSRFDLIEGKTYWFSELPGGGSDILKQKNTLTFCHFKDKCNGSEFIVLNMHLAFANVERRFTETVRLQNFISSLNPCLPLIVTGDFNTFPFRREINLPFYDGDQIVSLIEKSAVKDTMSIATLGHFGPLSSTNFCPKKHKAFCSDGTNGIILDHIFVNDQIKVLAHGIDNATINGLYPSDHFPVIADLIF